MLSHSQREQLSRLNRDSTSFFSVLPRELIGLMNLCYDPNPDSEIDRALHNAAYARQEEVNALLAMLDKNPRLLLQAGDVVTPGGVKVRRVTPYEFALGAGDPELAERIGTYFARIPNGETEKARQYERYRPHIEGILTQTPYDLTPLIEMIKQASPADVTALLDKDMTHESLLRDAFIQFRSDHAPRELSEPCMHYNYANLKHAFDILDREWLNLYRAGGNDFDRTRLVWKQLIGFEMRRLPGVDRFRLAHGLNYDAPPERSYDKNDADNFPVTLTDDSLDGLGVEFAFDIVYGVRGGSLTGALTSWKTYIEQKLQACRTYAATPESEATGRVCDLLRESWKMSIFGNVQSSNIGVIVINKKPEA